MHKHVVKRGLDLPIRGAAVGEPVPIAPPDTVAYDPQEFRGLTLRPLVKPGDRVQRGAPLLADKDRPSIVLVSPVAGEIAEVRRGERRVLTDVVVRRTGDEAAPLRAFEADNIGRLGREEVRGALLAGGLWPAITTRPFDFVADPSVVPQAILVGAMETGPLQPGPEALLARDDGPFVQAGLDALKVLTDGPLILAIRQGESHPALSGLRGVDLHAFTGAHPTGDPGVQVNLVHPPWGSGQVWVVRAWDVARMGRLLLEGAFPAERVVAAVGAGVRQPRLVRTVLGAPLRDVVGDVNEGSLRWIRGSVLTGDAVDPGRWTSFYRPAVHVLPDEVERELFGWTTPQVGRFSAFRAFVTGFLGAGSRQWDLRPGLWGEPRAIIPNEIYQRMIVTPDIHPEFLLKALHSGDVEDMVQLGLLDLTMEEAALCAYVCPSKIEHDVKLREGLARYLKEA